MKILMHNILSEPARSFNEDLAYVADSSAWILDGSSGLSDKKYTNSASDGQWFVQKWNEYLQDTITDYTKNLKEIVNDGIDTIKNKYFKTLVQSNLDPISFPSSSIVIVRIKEIVLEYFILGDCTLVVESPDSTYKSIVDDRIYVYDNIAIREMRNLQKAEQISFDEARKRTIPLLRKHRGLKNKKNGYWILEFDTNAVEYAIHKEEKLHSETYLLLMSDGFSQLSTTFNRTKDVGELLALAKKKNLSHLYGEIREFVEKDNDCMLFPRLKRLDDASAIMLKIGHNS
jgi:hypothetical protein